MDGLLGTPPPGLVFNFEGRFCLWRGLSVRQGPGRLRVWEVDVNWHAAASSTLEDALFMAGQAAISEKPKEG